MTNREDISHQAISSYFIGPEAENLDEFRKNITTILDKVGEARKAYYPQPDGKKFIPPEIKQTPEFQRLTKNFGNAVGKTAELLGQHSVPFWSPRYEAHMTTDVSMVSLLGYFMTMIYNPNNVAIEASPFSTAAEILVGEQLCTLLGYNTQKDSDVPSGWGHITCDGTVANLESIWVARNLKFYPLSLYLAITEGDLQFVADDFKVETCTGEKKLFAKLSTWELLNLRPQTVLDLPKALDDLHGVSTTFIENALDKYNIQTTSKAELERKFNIDKPVRYMLSNTRHYSWPKGGAIAGIGSGNILGIKVDEEARVDLADLVKHLEESLQNKQAVYAVVAIIGSTEEGAVDRLTEILKIRERFQKRGLSFLVHADAAWGGYFATMLPKASTLPYPITLSAFNKVDKNSDGFVPDLPLRIETQQDLYAMRLADSITIDPHKAGYIPYPAGSLVYRDERMRSLVTWTSPYIGRGSLTNIGIYGVEGSKPGAAAMSTWLSNQCIGLNEKGYGALLKEVTFTSTRLSAYWAATTDKNDSFICVPLNRLPSEVDGGDVEAEKQFIRDEILSKSNQAIIDNNPKTQAMKLLRALGSDLNINAFGLNWKYEDGTLNDDIEEANYLMLRVVKKLSISSPNDHPTEIEFYLTSTEFKHDEYGVCAENFMERLKINRSKENLMVMRNVVMSPFPTENTFMEEMIAKFKQVVETEVQVCRKRNAIGPAIHKFIFQGTTEEGFLVYQPSFQEAKYRRQLILKVGIDIHTVTQYKKAKSESGTIFLETAHEENLPKLLEAAKHGTFPSFEVKFVSIGGRKFGKATVAIHQIIKNRSLNSRNREDNYPSGFMPFYLYGTPSQAHISHMLLKSPNIELSAPNVTLDLDTELDPAELENGAILCFTDIHESSMQPFPGKKSDRTSKFFFRKGERFAVKVWHDLKKPNQAGPGLVPSSLQEFGPEIASGYVELKNPVHVDADGVNKDEFEEPGGPIEEWREEFEKIKDDLRN